MNVVSCMLFCPGVKFCRLAARRDERLKLNLSNEEALCHDISLSFASFEEDG